MKRYEWGLMWFIITGGLFALAGIAWYNGLTMAACIGGLAYLSDPPDDHWPDDDEY